MEVSRTLADPSFTVFACVFADMLAGGLSPFAHQVQGILEPSEFKRCELRAMRFLAKFKVFLPRVRGLLRVVSLLRQHVPENDLVSLVKAYGCGPMGRCFPTLFAALPGLLAGIPAFRGYPTPPHPTPPSPTPSARPPSHSYPRTNATPTHSPTHPPTHTATHPPTHPPVRPAWPGQPARPAGSAGPAGRPGRPPRPAQPAAPANAPGNFTCIVEE